MAKKLYIHANGKVHGVIRYDGQWHTTACGLEVKAGNRPSQTRPSGEVCKSCFRKGAI